MFRNIGRGGGRTLDIADLSLHNFLMVHVISVEVSTIKQIWVLKSLQLIENLNLLMIILEFQTVCGLTSLETPLFYNRVNESHDFDQG